MSVLSPPSVAALPTTAPYMIAELTRQGLEHHAAGDYQASSQAFRIVAETAPGLPLAWNNLALALTALGETDTAVAALRTSLALDRDQAQIWASLAATLAQLNRPDEAEAAWMEASARDDGGAFLGMRAGAPGAADAHLGRLAFARGDLHAAEAFLRRAAEVEPLEAEHHNNLGVALNALGEPQEARLAFERAIVLRADFVQAINNLGAALEAAGDEVEAIGAYRRALEIDPGYVEARDNLDLACAKTAPAWHFPMMADAARNDAYDAALRRAAPGRRVLDIGAGSGLLAMMAARAGAASVTSCEAVPQIAQAARRVIAANGMAERIVLHAMHSERLAVGTHLPERAEVLVTETFASGVLSEAVLPTIEHARRHLLTPDAIVIPRAASAHGYLVGGEAVEAQVFAPQTSGFDLSDFDLFAPSKVGLHLDRIRHEALSEDFEIFAFDLTQASFPAERRELTVTAARPGRCVGVAQWLRLNLDAETTYENRPTGEAGPNGWMHVLYRFAAPVELEIGDEVRLVVSHNRTAMTVALAV